MAFDEVYTRYKHYIPVVCGDVGKRVGEVEEGYQTDKFGLHII